MEAIDGTRERFDRGRHAANLGLQCSDAFVLGAEERLGLACRLLGDLEAVSPQDPTEEHTGGR